MCNANKFFIGEYEFNSTSLEPHVSSRFPEYSMTNDPEKVWPRATVHYVMNASLGKFMMTSTCTACSIHVCRKQHIDVIDTNTRKTNVLQFIILYSMKWN